MAGSIGRAETAKGDAEDIEGRLQYPCRRVTCPANKGCVMNIEQMLAETRFAEHFEFIGNFSRHYGTFAGCGTSPPFGVVADDVMTTPGCC